MQLIIYGPLVLLARQSFLGVKGERWPLIARGFFGFCAFSLAYYSFRLIPLADASTIVFSAPVYVSIFACFLLKEKCGAFQIATITITIIGVMLISKPTFIFGEHEAHKAVVYRMEGSILAFVSSLSTAFTFIMIRKLQKTPSGVVISAFSIVSIVSGIAVLVVLVETTGHSIRYPSDWTPTEWGWMIGNGLCGVLGQLFLTLALKVEEAGLVSLARTIDIVMAFIYQVSFLNEVVHWTSALGAVIVCMGVIVSAIKKYVQSKPELLEKWTNWFGCGKETKPHPKPITAVVGDVTLQIEPKNSGNLPRYVGLEDDKSDTSDTGDKKTVSI